MSSEFVATSDIPFGDPGRGVYAFRKGDRVPAELIESNGWQDFVSSVSSKVGQRAQSEAAGEPTTAKSVERKGS